MNSRSTIARVLVPGTVLLAMAALAHADAHLTRSVPADNSVIAHAPSQISLNFSEPIRITALSLQRERDKPTPIEISAKAPMNELDIPVTQLGLGTYTLNWRGVGADNHEASGTVHFTISGK